MDKEVLIQQYNNMIKMIAQDILQGKEVDPAMYQSIVDIQANIRDCDIAEAMRQITEQQEIQSHQK